MQDRCAGSSVPGRVLFPLGLFLAAAAAYGASLGAPFVMDDRANILDNSTIRALWPLPWYGPAGSVAAGRPVANLSFALSHALSGLAPWGYRAVNVLIHIAAMLLVYGIVGRSLALPRLRERFGAHARTLAFFSALLWGLHPLDTQAVTYISQRFESLAAMLVLAALYCAIRSWEGTRAGWWGAGSALAMLLAVGTKETAAVGPGMVYLFEAVLVRGSFREAARRSWKLYAGFLPALAWLGYLAGLGGTAQTIDFTKFTPWEYLITETRVISHYLRLAVFPYPLVMDYAWPKETLAGVWPFALALAALLAAAMGGVAGKSPAALCGALFFLALLVSSSVFPLMDAAFEYRMYLPLVPLCVLAVLGAFRLAGNREARTLLVLAGCAVAFALGLATFARNRDFRSEAALWADTAAKRPQNARAFASLGFALAEAGDCDKAVEVYEKTLMLAPDAWDTWYNLGNCMMVMGRPREAARYYQRSLLLRPVNASAHRNLAQAYLLLSDPAAAERELRLTLIYNPDHPEARKDLAGLLGQEGEDKIPGTTLTSPSK
ncbi:MAG: tetratricopeptide repeat protein [Thermodesulfobacteriota bacterium]